MSKLSMGSRFGRWTISGPRVTGSKRIPCRCDCGTEREVIVKHLYENRTKSCGCATGSAPLHGHAGGVSSRHTGTYGTWCAMKTRCTNPNHVSYKSYGGAGITICERWLHSFENFLADMGERPENMTLDRIDPAGNYEPDNCRWATHSEQRRNHRSVAK